MVDIDTLEINDFKTAADNIVRRANAAAQADTQPAPPIYKRHSPCGEGVSEYTEEEWKELPFVGIGPAGNDDEVLEYRNCTCGSTIAVTHPKSAVLPTPPAPK
jgi:hypothetical protein